MKSIIPNRQFQEGYSILRNRFPHLQKPELTIATNWDGKHIPNPKDNFFTDLIRWLASDLAKILPGRLMVTHSKVSLKPFGTSSRWLPHQDSGYKSGPAKGLTVCVFLEDVFKDSGCICVYPGTEKTRRAHLRVSALGEFFNQLYAIGELPPAVPITGNAGDVLIFDLNMVHSSESNTHGGNRPIFIFEVQEFSASLNDEGEYPMVLNGKMFWYEKIIANTKNSPYRMRALLVKAKRAIFRKGAR